jgi:hypothetical protein
MPRTEALQSRAARLAWTAILAARLATESDRDDEYRILCAELDDATGYPAGTWDVLLREED